MKYTTVFLLLIFVSTFVPTRSAHGQYAGESLSLDSAASYAVVDDVSGFVLSSGTAYTIETWVYPKTSSFVIASVYENGETVWSLRVGEYNSNSYRLILDTNDGYSSSSPESIGSSNSLGSEAWNHVAVTSDGSTVTFYVNGVASGSFSDGRSIWGFGSSATLYIGTEYVSGSSELTSYIDAIAGFDNLRFWKGTRTLDELLEGMIYTPATTTGLIADYTFDDTDDFTLKNGAATDGSEVPWIDMPDGYANGTALAWQLSTSVLSSALTVSSDDLGTSSDSEGEYLIVAYNDGDLGTTTTTSAADVTAQLNRRWGVVPIGLAWCSFEFDMNAISGIDADKAVAIVSTKDDLSGDVELIFPTSSENSYLNFSYYFTEYDTLFITLGELETTLPTLTASLGFGPFIRTDGNSNTFTLGNLLSGTGSVTFTLYDQYDGTVTDSKTTTGTDLSEATYTYDMGELAVGTILEVEIEASSLDANLTMVAPLAITEESPGITASDDFGAYILGTSRVNTYTVSSLPAGTTSVTFAFVDSNGDIVVFVDDDENVIYDSTVVAGADLSTASWTVRMDTLELPLGAKLSVTVEHEGGVSGGTEYLVDLEIYAAPMTIFSTDGFGPFVSNNYSRVVNSVTPWADVEEETNTFSVSPLPERTETVIFNIVDQDGDIVTSDTVSYDGTGWLSSAESSSISMTDLPPDVDYVEAVVFAQGGSDEGISVRYDLSILQQAPRISLDPSDYDDVPSNPYITDEYKTTDVTITVEPSTTENDSVTVEIVDISGTLLATMSGVPTTVDGVPQVSFTYDFASLDVTADSIIAYSWSGVSDDAVGGSKDITLIPPAPYVETWSGRDTWYMISNIWEFFNISGIVDDIEEVQVEIYNSTTNANAWTGTFTETTVPYSHSLAFDGSSTWFEVDREDSSFTILFWFRTSATGEQPLIGVANGSDFYPLLYLDGEGRVNYTLYGDHTSGSNSMRTIAPFNDGEWHHVAIAYDDAAMSLYIDGGLLGRESDAPSSARIGAGGSYIVGRGGSETAGSLPSEYFDGDMTELSFWNKGKKYSDIYELVYQEGQTYDKLSYRYTAYYGLVSYLPTDQGGGNMLYDWFNEDSVEVNGTAAWHLDNGLSRVVMPWNLFHIEEDAGDDFELRTTLFYDGGATAGETYVTSLPITWNDTQMWFQSDQGFGPFRQGVSADVDFAIFLPAEMDDGDEMVMTLVDSSGGVITTSTFTKADLEHVAFLYFTLDMGEAEPGSQIECIYIASGGDTSFSNVYPLIVEEFVVPTFSGFTGPFRHAIVDGTMADSNTFTIISDDDDLSFTGIFYGPTWEAIDTVGASVRNDTTWTLTYDMAALTPPLTRLVIGTYAGTSTTPIDLDTFALTITETRPDWFNSDDVSFSDVIVNDDGTISFTVTSTFNNPTGSGVINSTGSSSSSDDKADLILFNLTAPILGSLTMQGPQPVITADMTYDPTTETLALASDPELTGTLVFDSHSFDYSTTLSEATLVDNNLTVTYDWDWSEEGQVNLDGFYIPSSSFFAAIATLAEGSTVIDELSPIGPTVTFTPDALIGAATRINAGVEDDEWGTIGELDLSYDGESTNASYVLAQVGFGFSVGIGVQALQGAASTTFDMSFQGRVAGGTSFKSVPDYETDVLTSSGFKLSGDVSAKFLWGLITKYLWGPKTFDEEDKGDEVPEDWPTPSSGWIWSNVGSERDDEKGTAGPLAGLPTAAGTNVHTIHPLVWPQPNGATDGEILSAVWMEQDNGTHIGRLRLGTFGKPGDNLSDALTVVANDNAISNPQVVNLDDTIHLVTWTQSRYTSATLPKNSGLREIAQSLDIWYAIVNSGSGVVERTGMFEDDLAGKTSGRLEGNAVAARLSDSSALVGWIVSLGEDSDIYYATIERDGDEWTVSTPEGATTIAGIEHSFRLAGLEDGKAVGVWINRPGTDTGSTRVMSMTWDRDRWLPPVEIFGAQGGTHYNDLDVAAGNGYGLLGLTGAGNENGLLRQTVSAIPWRENRWQTADAVTFTSTEGFLQRPGVTVNEEGIGALFYQRSHSRSRSRIDGVDVILLDLKDPTKLQHHIGHPLLSDSTKALWDIHGAIYGDLLLTLVHETTNPYTTHEPVNGTSLGLQPMNLVLRGVKLTDDLDLEDVDEGDLLSSVSLPGRERPAPGFAVTSATPNPFGEELRITCRFEERGEATLELLNSLGERIAVLTDGVQTPGERTFRYAADALPNGAYFIRLTVDGASVVRTVLKVE